ncbi:MAG: rRNA adenine N-6-methyltransferase family protein [Chitinophagales bacterium]
MASELLKSFKTSGAVAFSSPRLVKKIISNIDFSRATRIIELGPGNGRITDDLLHLMRKDAILYAFEVNKAFCQDLEKLNDKRLKVFNESAAHIQDFISDDPHGGITYIVSSIPFGILPEVECDKIMKSIHGVSDKQTIFIQYSYSIIQYRRYKKYFPHLKVQFELINIPPAFVFIGRQ